MVMQIGDRMKSYEIDARLPKGVAIIRIDGKAFHTWTKKIKADKPFDSTVHECMIAAAKAVMKEAQGAKLAYTQSDEASFMLTNLGENEGAWFDYKVQKLASVTASIFTNAFAHEYNYHVVTRGYPNCPAVFDSRVYSVPVNDAANVFVWRQQDWNRNSIQMLGHHYFGHKAMQKVPSWDVIGKLIAEKNVDWDDLDSWKKYGTFIIPVKKTPEVYTEVRDNLLTLSAYMHYDEINQVTGLAEYLEE
jgi:tRNA(His) 5'-end guanylyltransferase